MVDDSGRVRQIAWLDVFPWLRLVKCPRLSLTISLVVLGLVGWIGMTSGWKLLGWFWEKSEDPVVTRGIDGMKKLLDWNALTFRPQPLKIQLPNYETIAASSDKLVEAAADMSAPAFALFNMELSFSGFCFYLLCTIWTVLVWSIIGAAITRIAALALTREHKLGFRGGLSFALLRWPSYAGGPALPIVACLMLAIPLLTLGWISRLDAGAFIVSLIWPLALIGGGLIALLAFGLMLGWPLMWPTISTEVTDSFDGLSRSYSYTLHRPLRYFGYVMFAGILGALLIYIVSFVVALIQYMTYWGFSIGSGIPRLEQLHVATAGTEDAMMYRGANSIFAFWSHLLNLIPLAVGVSYFWTAMTQIYLLLRRDEDGAELDEVFLPAQDKEFGLPPLKTDAAGVPTVAEPTPPAANSPDDTAMGSGN